MSFKSIESEKKLKSILKIILLEMQNLREKENEDERAEDIELTLLMSLFFCAP